VLLSAACAAAPTLEFFGPPPADYTVRKTFSDTILVMRHGSPDSVSAEGIHLAYDLLDRADSAGRADASRTLRELIAAVPDSLRTRERKPGSQEGNVIRSLQRKRLVDQLIVMRADVLVVKEVAADTVSQPAPESEKDDEASSEDEETWLAMILTSDALVNSSPLPPPRGGGGSEEGR
jgi:hypothetical protein